MANCLVMPFFGRKGLAMNTRKNTLYNVAYRVFSMLLPLVTAPYLSRVVGTEGVGLYGYSWAISYVFVLIGLLGLENYGPREIARVRDDRDDLNRTFSAIWKMQRLVAGVTLLVWLVYVFFIAGEEKIISLRRYHTITESKNGAGATPIRTDKGWIHIAHGVRNTAAGLRYVLYAFMTALDDPSRVIAEPSGMLLGPMGHERVGDVSNVVFSNGAIADDDGKVYIYYASSDTRLHVAETDIDRLCDYLLHTPKDPLRSPDCVRQRCLLISHNLAFMGKKDD